MGGKEREKKKRMASTGMAKSKGSFCITLSSEIYHTPPEREKQNIHFFFLRLNPEEQSIIRLIAPLIEIAQEGAISTGTLLMGF